MHRFAWNARLYETLLGMGLVVNRVCVDGDPEKIHCLVVSADPKRKVPLTIAPDVGPPVKRSEVGGQ